VRHKTGIQLLAAKVGHDPLNKIFQEEGSFEKKKAFSSFNADRRSLEVLHCLHY
jgi:hypothetical protein